jgi:hypothetical protein
MVRWFAAAMAACVVASGAALHSQTATKPANPFSIAPPSERVEIDGSKNPELIPEWYVWETSFRQLHKTGTVPSVLNLTIDETRFLQMKLDQYAKSTDTCQREIEELRPLVGVAPNSEVNEKQRAIQLECRRRTLDIRDRLLAGVQAESAVAIASWVENLKTGIEISVPKRELAHFRQPR